MTTPRRPGMNDWHLHPQPQAEKLGFTEHTLLKAIDAIRDKLAITDQQGRQLIDALYEAGLVIREKIVDPTSSGPSYRGLQEEAGAATRSFQNYLEDEKS